MKLRRLSSCLTLVLSCAAACGDSETRTPPPTEVDDSSVVRPDGSIASCDQAPDGTPCGDAGVMHCLYGACVLNVCGDGVVAGNEACDDGDQDDGNNCNSLCQEPTCGNGVADGRDQCDDGNDDDSDGCTSTCRLVSKQDAGPADAAVGPLDAGAADAGDAQVTPQDAQVTPQDAQITPQDAQTQADASADATAPDATVCQQCVRNPDVATNPCRDYLGAGDMVAGCMSNADPVVAERCMAAVRCGITAASECAKDPAGLTKCFCGSVVIDNCFNPGASPDGACRAQVYAASGCTTPQCVGEAINTASETSTPAVYFGRYLLECATSDQGCGASCPVPQSNF